MTRARLAALAAVAALAGCSFMPKHERPVAPVPGQFPHAAAPAQEATPAPALPWQDFFGEPRLRELIATALRNNRDLRVAALHITQARAQYQIREADRLPTVGATVSGSRAPNPAGGSVTSYSSAIGTTAWEIDLFGRLASLGEAARAQFLATEQGRNAVQASLVAGVASTWLALAADEELLTLTRQTLETRAESLRLTRLRFENGASSELEVRQAESLVENARATLAALQRQRALDLNALGLLLGEAVPPGYVVRADTHGLRFPDLPAGTPSEVLLRRPDVQQAEHLLAAANANIGAARAAFFPRISLTAGLGTASRELSGLFGGGSWGFTAAPALVQTIFDAGRNAAHLQVARAQREIAVAQYERAIQVAFREVADALAGRATLQEQVAAQSRLVEAEAARYRLARLRYEGGVASYLDLLDAQRSLFSAQQALVQARLARLQNQVQLYRALGGGWAAPAAAP